MLISLKDLITLNETPELYEYVKEQMIELYNQLSPCNTIDNGFFQSFIMSTNPILRLGDNFKILGTLSILYEYKMIHNGGIVCKLEDFVVDKEHRSQGIGTELIEYAKKVAKEKGAYKIILDCSQDMIEYYKKKGFVNKNVQMCIYY